MARNASRILIEAIAVCATLIVLVSGSQCPQKQRSDKLATRSAPSPRMGGHRTSNTRDRAPLTRRDFILPRLTILSPKHAFGFDDHPKAT
ncbi:MAG TPA: hypothetical protein VEK74_12230 [Burkholderiaceae bacterium]|nr:hypothetical protein [Burkholderiaceae bacterium]